MALIDIINHKKLGLVLSAGEISEFAAAAKDPGTPDYQLAALLMAIRLKGMDARETAELTLAMAHTGDMLTPSVGGVAVDKHSTGGVGDTTTLILAPLVAACGGKVLKMSGRGLGHTGGTVDKLESIPGFQTELPEEEFLRITREVGCCVVGQTGELAPADKRLYALRDVTGTVDSIPLIASSIMSKKLAGGAQAIVLDVKCGSGALMKTREDSLLLARAMVDIGRRNGRRMSALITRMDEPLGSRVGNALEVREAIEVLSGRVKGPLLQVALALGSQMLLLSGLSDTAEQAEEMLVVALESGQGLSKLAEMITAQGGDARVCRDTGRLPRALHERPVLARDSGWLRAMDTELAGEAARLLGAGRKRKDDVIDPAVGYMTFRRLGDRVEAGEEVARLFHNDEKLAEQAEEALLNALTLSSGQIIPAPWVLARIDQDGKESSL
jgi:pyrimidine-nucleoside phosphorylase